MKSIQEILERGVTRIIDNDNLLRKLESGELLRIKFGIDPTSKAIHIGRAIPLWKLKQLQDLGHTVVLIIGDFTGMIGDASDKDSERPMLTKDQIQENLKTYLDQLSKIIHIENCEIHYNSTWLSNLSFEELALIANDFSVTEMLDRDNFSVRYKQGQRITLREFLYPLLQGYDSVQVKADLEVGGNDQYFNLLAGRKVQKLYNQSPQDIMTFEILEGLDGRKMSSSYGNVITITDDPHDMFGKVMSLRDELIYQYFVLTTAISLEKIQEYIDQMNNGLNPRDIKIELAKAIVGRYYNIEIAYEAEEYFLTVHKKGQIPEDIEVVQVKKDHKNSVLYEFISDYFDISKSEARRVILEGGIRVNGVAIKNIQAHLDFDNEIVIQKGKRSFKKFM